MPSVVAAARAAAQIPRLEKKKTSLEPAVKGAKRELLAPKPDLGDDDEGRKQYPGHPTAPELEPLPPRETQNLADHPAPLS